MPKTKTELLEEAKELGIEGAEGMNYQSLAHAVKVTNEGGDVTVEAVEEKTPAKKQPASSDPKGESVDIVNGDLYIRTFSKAEHGEDYEKLSDEFVSKAINRKKVPGEELEKLTVVYREEQPNGTFKNTKKVFEGRDFKARALAFAQEVSGSVLTK